MQALSSNMIMLWGKTALWLLQIFAVKRIYFSYNPPECEWVQTQTAGIFNISIRLNKLKMRDLQELKEIWSQRTCRKHSAPQTAPHTHGSDWSRARHTWLWLVQSSTHVALIGPELQKHTTKATFCKTSGKTCISNVGSLPSCFLTDLRPYLLWQAILLLHLFFHIMETI